MLQPVLIDPGDAGAFGPLDQGSRVITPGGAGTVAYVRMGAPDFDKPAAVSVVLDARRNRLGYDGTVYPVGDVRPLIN